MTRHAWSSSTLFSCLLLVMASLVTCSLSGPLVLHGQLLTDHLAPTVPSADASAVILSRRQFLAAFVQLSGPRGSFRVPVNASGHFAVVFPSADTQSQKQQYKQQEQQQQLYTLQVQSRFYKFPLLRVEVNPSAWIGDGAKISSAIHCYPLLPGIEWDQLVGGAEASLPLRLSALGAREYFMARDSFSVMSLLANPMAIMMGLSLLMMVIMPKMMENMDPEALKEAQEAQAAMRRGDFRSLLQGGGSNARE